MNRPIVISSVLIALVGALLAGGFYLSANASTSDFFMPHAHCYLFNQKLMWLHGGSDLLIGSSYVAISAMLAFLVLRARRELPFHWVMVAFAIFIVACGATHLMELWTLTSDSPRYWLSGWVKLITAVASLTTAAVLPPMIPRVLELLESARLSAHRRGSLERAYAELNERYTNERSPDLATLVRELAEAKAAAEQANATKDTFLSVLSHELRTPLTPALAAASALEANPRVEASELRDLLAIIRRNIELEARLVDDLLDHTRITRGKLNMQPTTLDLRVPLRDAVQIVASNVEKKAITLTTEIPAAPIHVLGDSARLAQVFSNLLTNAAKFTPERGRVWVKVATSADEVTVDFSDSGVGIPSDELSTVFEAFRQGRDSKTNGAGGLGLGLSIARDLVSAHGGRISARSEGAGRGATVSVVLPILPTSGNDEPTPTVPPEPETSRALRILLVEDHEDSRAVFTRLLQRWGHSVCVAGTVAEARTAIAGQEFDALLSDVGLPDGTGLDVVQAFRAKSTAPAVAMSGFGTEVDLARSRAAGFSEHLVKPVSAEQLRRLVTRVSAGTS